MTQTVPLISLSLNAFIRIYSMDPSKQIAEITRRMQNAGGYDYYRNLNLAIQAYINKKSNDEIEYILNNSLRPDEVSYNKIAFSSFINKFGSRKKISLFEKKGSFKLAGGLIVVNISPTFMIDVAGVMSVYHIWASQNPKIDKAKSNVACYLMKEAFKKNSANYDYKLFDAVSGKVYSRFTNTTAMAVETVAQNMAHWASI